MLNKETVKKALYVGEIFQNPQRGTSIVTGVNDFCIYYKRGSSIIPLPLDIFINICNKFNGKYCYTTDLKNYMPKTFSSKHSGHSCNCTFLFMLAEKMQLIDGGILGKGVRGNPYYVKFK